MSLRIVAVAFAAFIISVPAHADMKRKSFDRAGVTKPPVRDTGPRCGAPRPRQSAYCAERCRGSYRCARWKIIG